MPRHPLRPLPNLAHVLRRRRLEAGLSPREVEARSREMGERIPRPTLVRIEQGRQEPGVRRFYALLKLYDLPLDIVPDLLELEELAAEPPEETDPAVLYKKGLEFWKKGDFGAALAHVFAMRINTPSDPGSRLERQKGLLAFSIAASGTSKMKLAQRLIESLLLEPPDPSLRVGALIQAAICWARLGSRDMALGALHQAEGYTRDTDERDRALIAHTRADILLDEGRLDEAEQEANAAVERYARAGDTLNQAIAMNVPVAVRFAQGKPREALELAGKALEFAREHGHAAMASRRRLDQGRALLEMDRAKDALGHLQEALADAIARTDRELEFRAHFWLWKCFRAVGDGERATLEHQAACYFARHVDERTAELRELNREERPHEKLRHRRSRRR